MGRTMPTLAWQDHSSEPFPAGTSTVTLHSRSLIIRWSKGGWVWTRPTGVTWNLDNQTRRLPIVDVTRKIQWALWGLAALFSLGAWARSTRYRAE